MINAGSRTASSAGLSSYTTTTNQVADSGTVDIGQHYFAVSTNTTVTIQSTAPVATESGQQGQFTVFRTGPTTSALPVFYNVGGTAVPGTDYQALSGNVTIDSGNSSQNITVTPIANNTVTYDKTVTASLILTNTYFVGSPGQATLTIQDIDRSSVVPVGVASVSGPSGIDYHPVNSSLIVARGDTLGTDKNFKRVDSNGLVSNWTTLTGLGFTDDMGNQGEIKVGIVKITTNNWTQGDMYFGTGQPGKIGKISADGSTVVNTNWATLTNATQGVSETHVFLGGFYLDQTGVWNGDLIVVSGSGGVWRVTASTNATKVAQINDPLGNAIGLEGALSVPNDPAKYGPWAGKILTCAEATGLVFAIDTNGVATPYNLGATEPEDVLLIPSGQLFYMLDAFTAPQVNKVAQAVFASFAGDVLLVNELVSLGQCSDPALYIVHWDGGRFVVQEIPLPGAWEHATFAPIDVQ